MNYVWVLKQHLVGDKARGRRAESFDYKAYRKF